MSLVPGEASSLCQSVILQRLTFPYNQLQWIAVAAAVKAMVPNGSWSYSAEVNETTTENYHILTTTIWDSDRPPPIKHVGLLLIVIPMVTILGNLLVIISVLRYRALQTAINFLILGLAVADLLVALFVMPYAVYVHLHEGISETGWTLHTAKIAVFFGHEMFIHCMSDGEGQARITRNL
ncbi:hypothetical protein TELCIR_08091 [Teladorsagia circumcincta]|uniref:G-protein coupled receptors family 1 profile domain-containing protein n=1 Tax=Teladorsagia circumcincta TaxID=45464 RepID=A0A2G9UIJ9_TELCI|nr:hypothetical protein TELCIR_08091 [Teladorsagia circumcincta]